MYECDSPYHHISVTDTGSLRVLQFERNRQSSMYLDDPFETDFEYPGYFHLSLAVKPDAARTLVIGLGGGTVVKRMWRDYTRMRIDAVELDPVVVDVARRYFALPRSARIRVFVGDGREYLATTTETYDIVVVDAFDDDRIPRPLMTEEFLRSVRDRLSPGGVVAYNCIGSIDGGRSRAFRSFHRTVSNVWRQVWTFTVNDGVHSEDSNIVLLATDSALSTDELTDRIGDRVGGLVTVPAFELFADDLFLGAIRTGDVPLLLDEPAGKTKRSRR